MEEGPVFSVVVAFAQLLEADLLLRLAIGAVLDASDRSFRLIGRRR